MKKVWIYKRKGVKGWWVGWYESEAGTWRSAVIYSLVASCKLNGIDPFRYFRDVLARVSTHPADKIDELLPSEWKKLNAETDANVGGEINKVIKVA